MRVVDKEEGKGPFELTFYRVERRLEEDDRVASGSSPPGGGLKCSECWMERGLSTWRLERMMAGPRSSTQ